MQDANYKIQDGDKKALNFRRLITAAVLIPLLIAYILYFPPFPHFLLLLLVVSIVAMTEFFIMYRVPKMLHFPALILGGVLFYIYCLHPYRIPEAVFASMSILLLLRLVAFGSASGSIKEIGPIGVGFLYIAGFLSFQWFLRNDVMGKELILFLYVSVWLADSAAYYIGTYLGRNKISPAISPNKTSEGAIGSVIGGIAGAVIVAAVFKIPDISIMKAVFIGGILGVATVFGDLIESMFKRDAGVKDSGNLFPGHGGLLDKIDGFLLAGPVLYLILRSF